MSSARPTLSRTDQPTQVQTHLIIDQRSQCGVRVHAQTHSRTPTHALTHYLSSYNTEANPESPWAWAPTLSFWLGIQGGYVLQPVVEWNGLVADDWDLVSW